MEYTEDFKKLLKAKSKELLVWSIYEFCLVLL